MKETNIVIPAMELYIHTILRSEDQGQKPDDGVGDVEGIEDGSASWGGETVG